jgi:hypothetical protein
MLFFNYIGSINQCQLPVPLMVPSSEGRMLKHTRFKVGPLCSDLYIGLKIINATLSTKILSLKYELTMPIFTPLHLYYLHPPHSVYIFYSFTFHIPVTFHSSSFPVIYPEFSLQFPNFALPPASYGTIFRHPRVERYCGIFQHIGNTWDILHSNLRLKYDGKMRENKSRIRINTGNGIWSAFQSS